VLRWVTSVRFVVFVDYSFIHRTFGSEFDCILMDLHMPVRELLILLVSSDNIY
jgi:hypothetical protein